jgi:hypothetical protein
MRRYPALIAALAGLPLAAAAQTILPEIEPNNNKAQALANGPFILAHGDAISGITTGTATTGTDPFETANADYFIVKTAPLPLPVIAPYRHRLVFTFTGSAGHTTSVRGLSQSAGVIGTSEVQLYQGQTSSNPPRFLQWYGFGREEQLYIRITGTSNTIGTYFLTLESEQAPVTNLGQYHAGPITISTFGQGHTTDTAIWVYDHTFTAIPDFGNDNEPAPGATSRSILNRTFAPGTYYLAVTAADLNIELPAASDDRRRNMPVTDFPDIAISSAQTSNANLSFEITDANGTVWFTTFKDDRHIINWFRFVVTESPATGGCCFDDMTCATITEELCRVQNGLWVGVGTICASITCPSPGPCCLLMDTCHILPHRQCTLAGGFFGSGLECPVANCPPSQATELLIPPHSSTFSSTSVFSRGLWFVAPADFVIRGLRVPDPAAHGLQNVEVMRLNITPPSDLAGTNDLTSLFRRTGVPSEVIITTDIPVQAGQMIGILGGCGDFGILHSSYSTATTFNTEILGQPTTLRRLGMQHNLVRVPARGVSSSNNEIGRVEIYYSAPGPACYPNCDNSTQPPILNIADFSCFLTKFAASDPYANCDGSTTEPVLNIADFSCFLGKFAAGCR